MTSRKAPIAILAVVLAGLLAMLLPASASAASPAWRAFLSSHPTNFTPNYSLNEGGLPEYQIELINIGSTDTSGPVSATLTLPPGITEHGTGNQVVELTSADFFGGTTDLHRGFMLRAQVPVDVGALAEGSTGTATLSVSGGGGGSAQAETTTTISSTPASFGYPTGSAGLSGSITDADGNTFAQAGGHPSQATLDFGFSSVQIGKIPGAGVLGGAGGGLRDLIATLPKGMIVNPSATPVRCTEAQFESDACPASSVVGGTFIDAVITAQEDVQPVFSPLYNMVPAVGEAAQLGFNPFGIGIYIHVSGGVSPGDYALQATSNDVLALRIAPVFGVHAELWGDPSAAAHGFGRDAACFGAIGKCEDISVPAQSTPFLSLPSSCGIQPRLTAEADSWLDPGAFLAKSADLLDRLGNPSGPIEGCGDLQFKPTLQARPTTNVADSPSGLSVDLHVPQTNDLDALATAHLRKAVVTLPEGLTLNPSSANGLEACSSAQIGIDPGTGVANGNKPSCPDASRIGDVEVDTPLLPSALHGSVYIAKPFDNPFDSLLAIYVVVEDPQTGVLIKLAGHVEPNPNTGRLVTTFDNNPQLPFDDFKLEFFGGPGAVLRTPSVCGTYSTTSSLTPWSAPESGPPATPSDSYVITSSCSSSEATQPNKPEFEAGVVSPITGKYTPFVLHLKRADGSQQFRSLTLTPPPGLTAKLAGTESCSEGALAAAASKSGTQEKQSPSCPASSQIGTVTVGAGAGPAPYYAKANAYLTGPYKGAPLGMAIVTPAVAGPYDLGTVVTRVALRVDPATAQITADADPVPSILQGIPLDVRSIDVSLDKPSFSRTGTSCDPLAVNGQLISTLGQPTSLESPYQLGECGRLAFKPKLGLRLKGATKRGRNPQLIANLTAKEGEAGISSAAVTLPRSAFLDQSHIRTVCTRVQFAAGAGNGAECPAGSIYGTASAKSPLLDYALTGNAYLRSSNNKLPDLVVALHGPPSQPIAIELVGRTDSVKGALRNSFESAPDAPVSSFRLVLFGGKRGLVVNSRNLCAHNYRAEAILTAHSGKVATLKPLVRASCPKGRKKSKPQRRGLRGLF